jgi:hypothetical protein
VSTTPADLDDDFTPPAPPRSRWRLRTLALWVFGVCAVIVAPLFVGRWQVGRVGQRQLDLATEQLDANQPGWRFEALAERNGAAPPAADDAGPRILAVAERIPDDWVKWRKSEEAGPLGGRDDNHLPPQEALDAAKKYAADTLIVRADAVRLRDARGGRFQLEFATNPLAMTFPHLDRCRVVVALLQYDAYLSAAADKNPNRGISAARAALAVGRAIGDEPFLLSQLVRIACATVAAQTAMQVLAWGEPTEGLAELQAELLAEADAGHFRMGLRGELGAIDRVFRGLGDGTIPAKDWGTFMGTADNPGPADGAAFRAYRALLPGDHAKALEILTKYVAASHLPPHEQLAAVKAVPIPPGPPDEFRYVLARRMIPAASKIAEAGLRCRAETLFAATGTACERFRQKHARRPRDLNELVPAFLPAVPLNPFDGKPLGYRTFEDRIAVFGFWPDAPQGFAGLSPDFRQGDAPGPGIGYRVWVPDRRGLPGRENTERKGP